MSTEPETESVRARDVKPYHWAMWCSIEGGPAFANWIVSVKWSDDGRYLWWMLDSHNFDKRDPDEMVNLIRLAPSEQMRKKYGSWTLPPPPVPPTLCPTCGHVVSPKENAHV